jgi:hypothetical protein
MGNERRRNSKIGKLSNWNVGMLECLECWNIGMRECWNVWNIGMFGMFGILE